MLRRAEAGSASCSTAQRYVSRLPFEDGQKATSSELLTALTVTWGKLIAFSLSRAGRTSIAPMIISS
jgi:hypothetical protein